MENEGERKRKSKEEPANGRKKICTDSTPKEQLDEPLDPYILQYQNSAMLRSIEEYKRELQQMNQKVESLQVKQACYDNTLSCINRHWDQLEFILRHFVSKLSGSMKHAEIESQTIEENDVSDSYTESQQTFLQLLLKCHKNNIKISDVDEALSSRTSFISETVDKIANAMKEQVSTFANFRSMLVSLKDGSATKDLVDQVLVQDNQTLRKSIEQSQQREENLLKTCSKVKEELAISRDVNCTLEEQIKTLRQNLDDTTADLQQAQRNIDKLKQLNSQPVVRNPLKTSTPPAATATTTTSTTASISSTANSESTEESSQDKNSEDIKDSSSLAESRLEEIQELEKERLIHLQEINKLRQELAMIPDDKAVKTKAYLVLKQQAQAAVEEAAHQRSQVERLQRENLALGALHKTDFEKFEAGEFQRREVLEKELRESKTIFAQYRRKIEELSYSLERQKLQTVSPTLVSEMKVLLATQEKQIKNLKEECEQLRADAVQLVEMKAENRKLEDKLLELQQKEGIENHTSSSRDMKAQHRSKDKEKVHSSREEKYDIDKLKQKIDQLSMDKKELLRQIAKKDRSISLMAADLESQKQDCETLKSEIETITKVYEDMQDQNSRLMDQLSEKEDSNTQLFSEQIKQKQVQHLLEQQITNLNQKIEKLEEKCNSINENAQKATNQYKASCELLAKINEELRVSSALLESHKKIAREASQAANEMKVQLEQAHKHIAELKNQTEEDVVLIERESSKIKRLEEERATLKKKLERYSGHGSRESIVEEEVKTLRQKLRCPVCNDRKKDAVIAKCFHVFCRPCIQKNIDIRHRKCPSCGKNFGEGDVHNIFI